MTTNQNVQFVLNDKRNCRSNNMQKFFRSQQGRHMANHLEVIRFDKKLWFATLGWRVCEGNDTGFAGVRVKEVACQGAKAQSGYPSWQKGGDYEIVTDWFWDKYKEDGMISIPEIWGNTRPKQLKHSESHTF